MVGPVNEERHSPELVSRSKCFLFSSRPHLNVVKTCEKVTFTDEGSQ